MHFNKSNNSEYKCNACGLVSLVLTCVSTYVGEGTYVRVYV